MKKVLSVVLALVMMLSIFSVSFASANTEFDSTMVVGDTITVSDEMGAVFNGYYIVKYVAVGNGEITIKSFGEAYDTCNPAIEVYKDSMKRQNKIGDEENTDGNHNFEYKLNVVEGTVYFFAMYNSTGINSAMWDVTIICNHDVFEDAVCLTCRTECDHTVRDNIVGCCPCGESFVGEDIVEGKEYVVKSAAEYRWFRFDAKKTAPYIMKSENPDNTEVSGDQSADPAFIVVNESGEIVLMNDANISADNKNFNVPYLFTEGERYFIGVKDDNTASTDWEFSFESGSHHTAAVGEEIVEEQKVDEEGNLVFEEKKDENGNVVLEEKKDNEGNVVLEEKKDENGNVVMDDEGKPVMIPVMVPVMVPVMEEKVVTVYEDHELSYVPYKAANHNEAGYTSSVVCNKCNETIAGGDVIPQIPECVDANADNACDVCGKVMVEPEPEVPVEPEDPTKNCKCNCHKDGFSKMLFDVILFFQKIFRLNSVCSCGVRHY